MAFIGYSPWNDAAQVGQGIGSALANVMFQIPLMKRQLAQEDRRYEASIAAAQATAAYRSQRLQMEIDEAKAERAHEGKMFDESVADRKQRQAAADAAAEDARELRRIQAERSLNAEGFQQSMQLRDIEHKLKQEATDARRVDIEQGKLNEDARQFDARLSSDERIAAYDRAIKLVDLNVQKAYNAARLGSQDLRSWLYLYDLKNDRVRLEQNRATLMASNPTKYGNIPEIPKEDYSVESLRKLLKETPGVDPLDVDALFQKYQQQETAGAIAPLPKAFQPVGVGTQVMQQRTGAGTEPFQEQYRWKGDDSVTNSPAATPVSTNAPTAATAPTTANAPNMADPFDVFNFFRRMTPDGRAVGASTNAATGGVTAPTTAPVPATNAPVAPTVSTNAVPMATNAAPSLTTNLPPPAATNTVPMATNAPAIAPMATNTVPTTNAISPNIITNAIANGVPGATNMVPGATNAQERLPQRMGFIPENQIPVAQRRGFIPENQIPAEPVIAPGSTLPPNRMLGTLALPPVPTPQQFFGTNGIPAMLPPHLTNNPVQPKFNLYDSGYQDAPPRSTITPDSVPYGVTAEGSRTVPRKRFSTTTNALVGLPEPDPVTNAPAATTNLSPGRVVYERKKAQKQAARAGTNVPPEEVPDIENEDDDSWAEEELNPDIESIPRGTKVTTQPAVQRGSPAPGVAMGRRMFKPASKRGSVLLQKDGKYFWYHGSPHDIPPGYTFADGEED